MPAPLSTTHRNRLQAITSDARDEATRICRAALENLAVHEGDFRPHMTVDQRLLRNRLRARGKALGDARDERSGRQELKRLAEEAAYEHWHRLLFTRFLAENHLLITDAANGSVPVTLEECEELASELGAKDGFELAYRSFLALPEVTFLSENPRLEPQFVAWTDTATFPPHRWTDAWLAAQAITTGSRLVSFDSDFLAFPGLSFLHLTAS